MHSFFELAGRAKLSEWLENSQGVKVGNEGEFLRVTRYFPQEAANASDARRETFLKAKDMIFIFYKVTLTIAACVGRRKSYPDEQIIVRTNTYLFGYHHKAFIWHTMLFLHWSLESLIIQRDLSHAKFRR